MTRSMKFSYIFPSIPSSFPKPTQNQWHTLVLGVNWEKSKEGFFKVYYDGKKLIDLKEVATTMKADNRAFAMRVGLYATDWHNHHNHQAGKQVLDTLSV